MSTKLEAVRCFRTSFPFAILLASALCGVCVSAAPQGNPERDPRRFASLYGEPLGSKQVESYWVMAPFAPPMAKLDQAFVSRRYLKGQLSVEVLFGKSDQEAWWARLNLPSSWTDEQLTDALARYGSNWEEVAAQEILGLPLSRGGLRKVRRSETGVYAWHLPSAKQLIIFWPELIDAYKRAVLGTEEHEDASESGR